MLELLRTSLGRRLKYLAAGVAGVALAGGMATTVSLSGSSAQPLEPKSTHAAPAARDATKHATQKTAQKRAEKADPAGSGSRPTDTHGYCVSRAVAAAKAAKKTGQDVAAAARACPRPNHAAGASRAPGKATPGTRGKSSTAPGHARTPD